MSGSSIDDARRGIMDSMATLCALEVSEDGAGRIDAVKFHRLVQRRSRYQMLVLVAGLDREGAF
ncbi:MAG TPA: hypothetical protein VGP05_15555, partial [Pseudonocardia sp.]|nr:hypothetical protein [Pseudonocardia sp.]